MKIILNGESSNTSKRPADAFTKCPDCSSTKFISVDDDLICCGCDWNSCKASVDAGLFDNFFSQADSHYLSTPAHKDPTNTENGIHLLDEPIPA